MPEILTLREIDELEKVCAAATEGPWKQHGWTIEADGIAGSILDLGACANADQNKKFCCRSRTALPAAIETIRKTTQALRDICGTAMSNEQSYANAAFLLAALDGIEPAGPD